MMIRFDFFKKILRKRDNYLNNVSEKSCVEKLDNFVSMLAAQLRRAPASYDHMSIKN